MKKLGWAWLFWGLAAGPLFAGGDIRDLDKPKTWGVYGNGLFARPLESASGIEADYTFCYIVGAGGGNDYIFKYIPEKLAERGIPWLAFEVGNRGTVQERAQKLKPLIEKVLIARPNLRCHFLGYSMGGVTLRYALAHIRVQHPTRGEIGIGEITESQTTLSTPHRGTYLAELPDIWSRGLEPGFLSLTEDGIRKFNEDTPENQATFSPMAAGIPFFSYRTFLPSKARTPDPLEQIGYDLIWQSHRVRHRDPRSDGIVPTDSQGLGEVLSDMPVGHSYFSAGGSIYRPESVEFYEIQWNFLTKNLDAYLEPSQVPFPMLLSVHPEWERAPAFEIKTDSGSELLSRLQRKTFELPYFRKFARTVPSTHSPR